MKEDKRTPFLRQCFVTGAICCNIIGHGCGMGFPAILLPQLHNEDSKIKISIEAESWIASIGSISLLIGNFITPPISGKLGRRTAHIVATFPMLVGWFSIILASTAEIIILGRILQGLSTGMLMPLRSMLIGEYTSPRNRGAFLATVALSQAFGIFFVHLIGTILPWQRAALVCVFFSYTSLILTIYSPESPSFLAAKGNIDKCRITHHWLRGHDEDEELEAMIQSCVRKQKERIRDKSENRRGNLKDIVKVAKDKLFYKPLILMSTAFFMTQFTGGTTMASYSTKIIKNLMGPEANAQFWMVFLDAQRIISNTAAVFVINKVKRRTMMFATGGLCVLSKLTIAIYAYSKINGKLVYDAPWIPVVLINLQFFSVAVGTVPMPSVIAGEVFPLEYRSIGSSMSVTSLAFSMFLVLKTFPFLLSNIGLHGTYTIYSVVITICLIVIWYLLPETKDKTLQQIEDEFRGRPLLPLEAEVRKSRQERLSYKKYSSIIAD